MSSTPKRSTLRTIVPKILTERVIGTLDPFGKVEAREIVLKTGGLTTDGVVRYIKDYSKLRDEVGQAIRTLGIERESEPIVSEMSEMPDLAAMYGDASNEAREALAEYQKILSQIETVDRQSQEVEKQMAAADQLNSTGFSYDELVGRAAGFRRILGRIPSKKLQAAQKAVRATLGDRAVTTTGGTKNSWVYLLVATPTENASQTLQILLLYDFVQTDIPSFEGQDPSEALKIWQSKKDELMRNREALRLRIEDLRKAQAGPLNVYAGNIQETLLLLRSSLRLGEGTNAAYVVARLERTPPAVTLTALQKDGVVDVD